MYFYLSSGGTWGADKVKRNKKENGKEIDGRVWQDYPENIENKYAINN